MKEFWFCLNTKVYFGCDSLERYIDQIQTLGKRILIVTGRHSAKASGLLERVERRLEHSGIKYFEFCEVEENPTFQTIERGAEFARKNLCDCVLGMGGGSPMDAAKGIAVRVTNQAPAKEFAGEDKFSNQPLPIMAIPTTAGTGSEITRFAVIVDKTLPLEGVGRSIPMDKEQSLKKTIASLSIMPRISICDPQLTLTLPARLTASTGMDALAHAIEGYLSKRANPVSDILDIEAIRLGISNLKQAVDNGQNLEARSGMLLCSLVAGMALNHTGTIMAHGMGYALTLDHGRQHGEASGIILPYLLEHLYERKKDRIDKIAQALGGLPWQVLKQLNKEIALPASLKDIGIEQSTLDVLSERMIVNSSRSVKNIDFAFSEDDFRQVIQRAYSN